MTVDSTLEKFGERIGNTEQCNAVMDSRLSTVEKTLEKACEKLDGLTLRVTLFTGGIVALITYLPQVAELFR